MRSASHLKVAAAVLARKGVVDVAAVGDVHKTVAVVVGDGVGGRAVVVARGCAMAKRRLWSMLPVSVCRMADSRRSPAGRGSLILSDIVKRHFAATPVRVVCGLAVCVAGGVGRWWFGGDGWMGAVRWWWWRWGQPFVGALQHCCAAHCVIWCRALHMSG